MPNGSREVTVKMDHGLYDGTLLRILDAHFRAFQHDETPSYTPFHKFAIQIASSNKQRSLKFWNDSNRKPTNFHYPRLSNPSITRTHVSSINLDLSSGGQTPSIIFQAAYQIFLSRRSGFEDVSFDYLYTGRNVNLPNPQDISGNCANFLPLRSQLSIDATIRAYLEQTNTAFWCATEHSNVGLTEIYAAAQVSRQEFTNTGLFLFQPFDPPAKQGEEMRWVVMAASEVRMPQPYGLVFEVMKMKEGWKFKIGYDARAFDREGAEGVGRELEEIVRGLVEGDMDVEGGLGKLMAA